MSITIFKRLFSILSLIVLISCSKHLNVNGLAIKGVWGLTEEKYNDSIALKKFDSKELTNQKYMLSENFKNLMGKDYKVLDINDSISFYHRKIGVENNNYKDENSYKYDYSGKYRLVKTNNKIFLEVCIYSDTSKLEIFSITKDKLEIEAIYGDRLYIYTFNRLK
jgi:hypothetical protein